MKKILLHLIFLCALKPGFAQSSDTIKISNDNSQFLTNKYFTELVEKDNDMPVADVIKSTDFRHTSSSFPAIKYYKSVNWLKFTVTNNTNDKVIPISIGRSIIDEFEIYYIDPTTKAIIHFSSLAPEFNQTFTAQTLNFINVPIKPGSSQTMFIRIKSKASAIVPVEVHSVFQFGQENDLQNILNGGIMGIFFIMALFNLMLFITVNDRSYLYYVFYIVALGVSQILILGYGNNLFVYDKATLNNYVFPVARILFGYSILLFSEEFLQLKQNLKKYHKAYKVFYGLYTLPLIATIIGWTSTAFLLITVLIFIVSIMLLFIGSLLYRQGYRPAKFFMVGWGLSLSAIILSVGRNNGVVPYSHLMSNIVIYCAVIELVLFSVALADKINFYRFQQEQSQFAALTIARENERLITEQNILLENKVKERTQELIETNQNLSLSIENLKSAQLHLVETEKMASLGQLTAGVAHEINNPINFVSANVAPLKLDFNELFTLLDKYESAINNPDPGILAEIEKYKQKIDPEFVKSEIINLLSGIEDGANRTSEIVRSLRTFSRLDELVLKPTDINTAILNTLILLRSSIPYYIEVKTILNSIEPLNCYSGKINQVLVNLINNSIQAIKAKDEHNAERILIITADEGDHISVKIADTGIGMSNEVRQRIFEPFFTTKDVGEGTGLGLSIVFGIIETHHGAIDVQSTPGKGTTFTVTLPKNLE